MNSVTRLCLTISALIVGVILSGIHGQLITLNNGSTLIGLLYHFIGSIGLPFMAWRACSAMMPRKEISNQPES